MRRRDRNADLDCTLCATPCRYEAFRADVDVREVLSTLHQVDKAAAEDGQVERGQRGTWTHPERPPGVSRGVALHWARSLKLAAWRHMLEQCPIRNADEAPTWSTDELGF